jgi:hypothetical protein
MFGEGEEENILLTERTTSDTLLFVFFSTVCFNLERIIALICSGEKTTFCPLKLT